MALQFLATAGDMLRAPLREPDRARTIRDLYAGVPAMLAYLSAAAAAGRVADLLEAGTTLALLRDELALATLCDNHHLLYERLAMHTETPTDMAMPLFLLAATVDALLTHARTLWPPPEPPPAAWASWHVRTPASALPGCACVCGSARPVCEYAVSDLVTALRLLGARWHEVTPDEHLERFLMGLMARAFEVLATPQDAATHDAPVYRERIGAARDDDDDAYDSAAARAVAFGIDSGERAEPADEPGAEYRARWNLVRRFAGGLVRMLALVRFWRRAPRAHAEDAVFGAETGARVAAVRAVLATEVVRVERVQKIRAEVRDAARLFLLWIGDTDLFVERNNMEEPLAQQVLVAARPPSALQMMAQFDVAFRPAEVVRLDEAAPHCRALHTLVEMRYAQIMKLATAELVTAECGVALLADYCHPEANVVPDLRAILEDREALLVMLFGRFHVVCRGALYRCRSTEHALATWVHLVQTELGDTLGGAELRGRLAPLTGAPRVYADDDEWRSPIVGVGGASLRSHPLPPPSDPLSEFERL